MRTSTAQSKLRGAACNQALYHQTHAHARPLSLMQLATTTTTPTRQRMDCLVCKEAPVSSCRMLLLRVQAPVHTLAYNMPRDKSLPLSTALRSLAFNHIAPCGSSNNSSRQLHRVIQPSLPSCHPFPIQLHLLHRQSSLLWP
jgi:hypothetical protein